MVNEGDRDISDLRIAFISNDGSLKGGASRSLLDLIDGLEEYNVEPFVLSPSEGELTRALAQRGITYGIIPFRSWLMMNEWRSKMRAVLKISVNLMLLPWCVWTIRKWDVDVIFTKTSVTPVGALASIVLRKPHVWHITESLWLGLQMKHILREGFFKYLLNRSHAVIAISDFIKQTTLSGVTTDIHIIYNGVIAADELEGERKRAEHLFEEDGYTFAHLGHMMPSKGQEEAIRAFARLKDEYPRARLLIVGPGKRSYVEQLKGLCVGFGIRDQVEFGGYIPDPSSVYDRCDAVVISSKNEGLSRVAAEAMAKGKPVIGHNSGGIPEVIDDGITGLLYEDGDEELAGCMCRFMDNRSWAHELGLKGQDKAYREYTIEICAEQVAEVLKEVMRQRHTGYSSLP